MATALPSVGMMNLVLGATEPGALADGHLAGAAEWVGSRGVESYVPVTPGQPETGPAERWLAESGFSEPASPG